MSAAAYSLWQTRTSYARMLRSFWAGVHTARFLHVVPGSVRVRAGGRRKQSGTPET